MGHKGPVLRPRCIGPWRAWTQIPFNSIPSFWNCANFDNLWGWYPDWSSLIFTYPVPSISLISGFWKANFQNPENQMADFTVSTLMWDTKMCFKKLAQKWFLINDQRDAQILFYVFVSIYNSLHVLSISCHHQERQIVSIQPLATVILCWWPRFVQVGSLLPTCTHLGHQRRRTVTRSCIDTICLSWWWAQWARNM